MRPRQSVSSAISAFTQLCLTELSLDYAEKLGIQSGTIFGAPIPKGFESVGLEIQKAVDQAVRDSEDNGIAKSGRDATPWLLSRVKELTKGISIPSSKPCYVVYGLNRVD